MRVKFPDGTLTRAAKEEENREATDDVALTDHDVKVAVVAKGMKTRMT